MPLRVLVQMKGVRPAIRRYLPKIGKTGWGWLACAHIPTDQPIVEETGGSIGVSIIGNERMNRLNVVDVGVDEGSPRRGGLGISQLLLELSNELLAGERANGLRQR
jgi:hypothetical protein